LYSAVVADGSQFKAPGDAPGGKLFVLRLGAR
jgi:hypothetical protein